METRTLGVYIDEQPPLGHHATGPSPGSIPAPRRLSGRHLRASLGSGKDDELGTNALSRRSTAAMVGSKQGGECGGKHGHV